MNIRPVNSDDILTTLKTVRIPGSGSNVVEAGLISGITVRGTHVGFVLECDAETAGTLETACRRALESFPGITQVSIVTTNPSSSIPPSIQARPRRHDSDPLGRWTRSEAESPKGEHRKNDANLVSEGESQSEREQRDALPANAVSHANNSGAPKQPRTKHPLPNVTRIIAIAAGKGGVGKSTLTVLLAHALTARGKRVAICDTDIYGPSIPRMLGLPLDQPRFENNLMQPHRAHGIAANSIAFITGDAAAIMRGPMVSKSLNQLLHGTDWACHQRISATLATASAEPVRGQGEREARGGEPPVSDSEPSIDFLLLDLPPGTGDVQLSLMQSLKIDGAILLTTPQEIAVMDARKAGSMFRKLDIPILGIVENMSFFIAPDGSQHVLFGTGGGETLARAFGEPFLTQLPLDPTIGAALERGENPLTDTLATALNPVVEKLLLN